MKYLYIDNNNKNYNIQKYKEKNNNYYVLSSRSLSPKIRCWSALLAGLILGLGDRWDYRSDTQNVFKVETL